MEFAPLTRYLEVSPSSSPVQPTLAVVLDRTTPLAGSVVANSELTELALTSHVMGVTDSSDIEPLPSDTTSIMHVASVRDRKEGLRVWNTRQTGGVLDGLTVHRASMRRPDPQISSSSVFRSPCPRQFVQRFRCASGVSKHVPAAACQVVVLQYLHSGQVTSVRPCPRLSGPKRSTGHPNCYRPEMVWSY